MNWYALSCLLIKSTALADSHFFQLSSATEYTASNVSADLSPLYFDGNQTRDFGLRTEYTWSTLLEDVSQLNQNNEDELFRVVFLGRHGEGVHNVAERKYGSDAWDEKWSKLNGDEELTWGPDAKLTDDGKEQARLLHNLWKEAIQNGLSYPTIKYSSPLSRALETAEITYDFEGRNPQLHVLEGLRETIGVHTCDQRLSKTEITHEFPHVVFEKKFEERDMQWTIDMREADHHVRGRARQALNTIMSNECNIDLNSRVLSHGKEAVNRVISIAAHSGLLRNLYDELGLGQVRLETGAMLGLLLRSTCEAP